MSSSKNNKSVRSSDKRVQKFASKYVGGLLDQLIEKHINSTKYPKLTEKWLFKMKSSILKKISEQSKLLFVTEKQSILQNEAEITDLVSKIKSQTERIRSMAASESKLIADIIIKRPVVVQQTNPLYELGKFEPEADKISKQFGIVANQLITITPDIEYRVQSFETSLYAIKPNLQPILLSLQNQQPNKQVVIHNVNTKDVSTTRSSRQKNSKILSNNIKDPLQQLQQHLHKK